MKKKYMLFIGGGILLLSHSIGAQTWTAAKRLTWNSGDSGAPAIAITSNSHIHIVWNDKTPGNVEICYKRSTNGGINWTTKRLTFNPGNSLSPAIAVDSNNNIHLVWMDYTPGDYKIFYKKSTDGGVTWQTKRLDWGGGKSSSPDIAVDSANRIHVSYHSDSLGNNELFHKKSTDSGENWETRRRTYNSGESRFPTLSVDDFNTVHLAWEDNTPGSYEIYYLRGSYAGTVWDAAKRLTWNAGDSRLPAVEIVSGDDPLLLWQESDGPAWQIYRKRSTNEGLSWTGHQRISPYSQDSRNPAIKIDGSGTVHCVYQSNVNSQFEIFHQGSTDNGNTWNKYKRLTWNNGWSTRPAIAIGPDNHIHVVWSDSTPGNNEIFYRKGIQ